jgi:inosine/xanthosine triphosphate pyrophosphatase family protein
VQLTELEPGIYAKRYTDSATQDKIVSVQLIEQEPDIYVERYPDSAKQDKIVSVLLTEQEPGIYAKATLTELGGTKQFLCS